MPHAPRDAHDPDRHLRTDHLHRDVKRLAVRGGVVTLTSQAVKVVVQFAAIVVLARLLSPADFGLFAMMAAFLVVLETLKDLGLSAATVQRRDVTSAQVSTLFWINVALAFAAAAAFAALGPVLALLYGEPVLAEIVPVVALALLFTGLASQHLALLRRQMRFTAVALILTGAEMIALAAAIAAAVAGFGLWSLVIQRLAWGVAIAAGAWTVCDWRPGRPGRFAEVKGMLAFGGNATLAMVVGRIASSCDKVLIGWYWGAVAVGLFERAQKLLVVPVQNLNGPLAPVALSALSRMRGDPRGYRDAYAAAAERLVMIVAPASALMIAAPDAVVGLVLGAQWDAAAPILGWMGLAAIYMPLTYTLSWLYMSQDRTGEMLRANIVNGALTVLALLAGLPYGPAGVAAAYALSGLVVRMPVLIWLVGRRGPVGAGDCLRVLMLPAAATAAASLLILALDDAPQLAGLSDGLLVLVFALVAGFACLGIYAAVPRGRRILLHTLRLPAAMLKRA